MDERLKQLLKELGDAINESISGSQDVNDQIQRIREEGYNLYVYLDATIGLGKEGGEIIRAALPPAPNVPALPPASNVPQNSTQTVQFRIDVNDLSFLRGIGIDPTRKVKSSKRLDTKRSEDAPN